MHLVKLRTSLVVSLQNIICRNNGFKLKTSDVKALREDRVAPYLSDNEDLALAGTVSKESIDYLTRQINKIEAAVEDRLELKPPYVKLKSIFGIGKILALVPASRGKGHGSNASPMTIILMRDWYSKD